MSCMDPRWLAPLLCTQSSMSVNAFSFSSLDFGAFSDSKDHLGYCYPTTESTSIDNMFFPESPETNDPPLNPYGEIDWSLCEYNDPFTSSPTRRISSPDIARLSVEFVHAVHKQAAASLGCRCGRS